MNFDTMIELAAMGVMVLGGVGTVFWRLGKVAKGSGHAVERIEQLEKDHTEHRKLTRENVTMLHKKVDKVATDVSWIRGYLRKNGS